MGKGLAFHGKLEKGSTDVWLTPLDLIKPLGDFDLDPCGEIFHKTAKKIYTENGLESDWFGRVWCNPPYSNIKPWLDKLAAHGNGIALVFARLDTVWAQDIIPKASSVFFKKGRIRFLKHDLSVSKCSAGAPSMFLSFGEIPDWNKLDEQGLIWVIDKRT